MTSFASRSSVPFASLRPSSHSLTLPSFLHPRTECRPHHPPPPATHPKQRADPDAAAQVHDRLVVVGVRVRVQEGLQHPAPPSRGAQAARGPDGQRRRALPFPFPLLAPRSSLPPPSSLPALLNLPPVPGAAHRRLRRPRPRLEGAPRAGGRHARVGRAAHVHAPAPRHAGAGGRRGAPQVRRKQTLAALRALNVWHGFRPAEAFSLSTRCVAVRCGLTRLVVCAGGSWPRGTEGRGSEGGRKRGRNSLKGLYETLCSLELVGACGAQSVPSLSRVPARARSLRAQVEAGGGGRRPTFATRPLALSLAQAPPPPAANALRIPERRGAYLGTSAHESLVPRQADAAALGDPLAELFRDGELAGEAAGESGGGSDRRSVK